VAEHLGARRHAELRGAPHGVLDVLRGHGDEPRRGHEQLGDVARAEAALLEEGDVGLDHLLEVGAEEPVVPVAGLEQPLGGAEEREPEPYLGDEAAAEEVAASDLREARDLGRGEAERAELPGDRSQGAVDASAEDARVGGHHGGHLLGGEPEVLEEGEHGVRVGGGLEVREALGCLERLRWGEVAAGDEVVLDGEGARRSRSRGGGCARGGCACDGEAEAGAGAGAEQGDDGDGSGGGEDDERHGWERVVIFHLGRV